MYKYTIYPLSYYLLNEKQFFTQMYCFKIILQKSDYIIIYNNHHHLIILSILQFFIYLFRVHF